MILIQKVERAVELFHEKMTANRPETDGKEGLDTEKGDVPAMIIAAVIVFVPVVVGVLLLLIGIPYLIMFFRS